MKIKYEDCIDWFEGQDNSRVFQVFPDCFSDNRGYFMEVFKNSNNTDIPNWLRDMSWVKQVNRSSSSPGVIRGCHAQKGNYCQGKMVEAVNNRIYDIITDARPNSKTFGASQVFLLDPIVHNKLWVPPGFLHAFVVPKSNIGDSIFEYFCNNIYNHESETGVNPTTILPYVVKRFGDICKDSDYDALFETFNESSNGIYSEKDMNAMDYRDFMNSVHDAYTQERHLWYV